jgi:CHAT domain-containing protein
VPERVQAELWNDLAVAHYEIGRRGDPGHIVIALDAVERARAHEDVPVARWTRAVLLETLNLHEAGSRAWKAYLDIDDRSEWAVEARERLAAWSKRGETASFPRDRLARACAARDLSTTRAVVAAFPAEARVFGEEVLLEQWSAATDAVAAERKLGEIRLLADALRELSGESLLADVVLALDRTRQTALHTSAVEGVRAYAAGRAALRRSDIPTALTRLLAASASLRRAGNPLVALATIYQAAAIHSSNRYHDVEPLLQGIDADLAPTYHAATGLRHWVGGLALAQTGRIAASADAYELSHAAFEKAKETGNEAAVLNLRAEMMEYMTATDEAWRDRMLALARYGPRPLGSRPLMWMSVATAAVGEERYRAAIAILDAIAADAEQRGDWMWWSEARMWRAVASARLRGSVSAGEMDEIRAGVERIPDRAVRERTQANFRLVTAELQNPATAAIELDRALAFFRTTGDGANLTYALGARAATDALRGHGTRVAALSEAIASVRKQSMEVPDPLLRTLFAQRLRVLLLLACRLEIEQGRPEAALWFSEQARSVGVEAFRGAGAGRTAHSASEGGLSLVRAVPSGTTVVRQEIVEDHLWTWVIRDGRAEFVSRPIAAADLLADIDELRDALEDDRLDAAKESGGRVHQTLFAFLGERIRGTSRLVYSPSGALRGMPAGALYDGKAFLFEGVPVSVTRSLAGLQHESNGPSTQSTVLLVAPGTAAGSEPLPGAQREASTLARIYGPRARTVRGSDLTPDAFLLAARDHGIIHVGAHGRTNRQPFQNALEFGDARLRAHDIVSSTLAARPVVVLAACRSDDETEGRSTLSLAGSFVEAGASGVVAALWDVDDQSTARLMVALHQELAAGVSIEEALRRAQLKFRARFPDETVWAAFQVHI